MEEVARYECVYHRNSKNFKDKNADCWKEIGEKFNLSVVQVLKTVLKTVLKLTMMSLKD